MSNIFRKTGILFTLLIFSIVAIAQVHHITGTTTGIEEGTWLYLKSTTSDRLLDSTRVKNGKFRLTGKTDEKIKQMILYTANYKNYVFFWAQQNTHLQLKNGEFKKGIITGSKMQNEARIHSERIEPIRKLQDSLKQLMTISKDEVDKKQLREKLNEASLAEKNMELEYIKNNPNSLNAAYILSIYSSTWGKKIVMPLYQNLSLEMKNTSYGKNISDFITINKEIKIGEQFVDFEQTNTEGKMVKLSDIKGKYILLEFWGSWCGPCREENPNLVKTYHLFKDKGFNVLGVAAEKSKEQWLKAVNDDLLPWENVSDLKGDNNFAALIYGVSSYPTNFLIDEKGVIIAKKLRGANLTKKLSELLD